MLTTRFPTAVTASGLIEKSAPHRNFFHFPGSNIGILQIADTGRDMPVCPPSAISGYYRIAGMRRLQ
jgi:hypothetical protein